MEALTLNLSNNVMRWCQESKYKGSHHGFVYQIQPQSEKDFYFLANLYLRFYFSIQTNVKVKYQYIEKLLSVTRTLSFLNIRSC